MVPNGIFDSWVRWDGGLDPARNSSVAAAAVAVAVTSLPHTSLPDTSCAAAGRRVIRASLFAHKLWDLKGGEDKSVRREQSVRRERSVKREQSVRSEKSVRREKSKPR